jgi:ribonuclease-3
MNVTKQAIETLVGTKINNLSLYQKAFTHKSSLKEHPHLGESYERLEFIGDSVLGFVITRFLYESYPNEQEGFLTKARTKLVRSECLAAISEKLNLARFVLMDEKGHRNGWTTNKKIQEDVFEALCGAIYEDLGLLHAKQFILRIYTNPYFVNMQSLLVDDNWKDWLMRHCQQKAVALPDYRVVSHEDGLFQVEAWVDGRFGGRGRAKTKKQAEQMAARAFFYPHLNDSAA